MNPRTRRPSLTPGAESWRWSIFRRRRAAGTQSDKPAMRASRQRASARIFSLVQPHRWRLAKSLILLLLMTGLGLITPWFGAQIIAVALPSQDWFMFKVLLVLMLVTAVLTALLNLLNSHNMRCVGGRIVFQR